MADNTYRMVEIVGTSPHGVDAAIRNAVARANQTLRHIDWFEMTEVRGHLAEGSIWLERAFALPGMSPPGARAEALYGAGWFAHYRGDSDRAEAHGEEALALAHEAGEGGTGLGLPIVQSLVALHGGRFRLRSELRKGTEAIVWLPPGRLMSARPQRRAQAEAAGGGAETETWWRVRADGVARQATTGC